MAVINPPESELAKRTSVQSIMGVVMIFKYGKRFRFAPSFNKNKNQLFLSYLIWNRLRRASIQYLSIHAIWSYKKRL